MQEQVREYYGRTLTGTADLKTSACCDSDVPAHLSSVLSLLHPEVTGRYYGCGLVVPAALEGCRVLDLGCGSGRDCYLLSALVGEHGHVTGVDMTDEQLAVARRHADYHRDAFGHGHSNVTFVKGDIERLGAIGLQEQSYDVVVSNCVINLCTDKGAVFAAVRRLLKPGGELYFSDVYADRRIPESLRRDPVLYGECLSGALYRNDFLTLARSCGFADPRRVAQRPLGVDDPELAAKLGPIRFESATWRLFAVDGLEQTREDYGQSATYLGTIAEQPDRFVLDDTTAMATGEPTRIDGNSWRTLAASRFAPHVELRGDFSTHSGAFKIDTRCAPSAAPAAAKPSCCGN